ncbi:MAG: hypothetical protein ACD_50C00078G0001, partial [uncultured bacterium]
MRLPNFLGKYGNKTSSGSLGQTEGETLEKGMVSIVDVLAPSSVEVDFSSIRVGNRFFRTFFVIGYPRFVSSNWLSPLIDFSHSLNISMFIYPVEASDVLSDLRHKIAEMEATIASQMETGHVV